MNANEEEAVQCPQCKSTQIHASKRGWNIWLGFIGSGKIMITCLKCGHRYAPGKPLQMPLQPAEPEKPQAKAGKLYEGVEGEDGEIPTYKL